MVAREKNLGYLTPLPHGGFRVLRMLKQAMRKGFRLDGCLIPEHARYKPNRRINQHLRRQLSASQDVVANRDFLHVELCDGALIHALEPPAQQNYT